VFQSQIERVTKWKKKKKRGEKLFVTSLPSKYRKRLEGCERVKKKSSVLILSKIVHPQIRGLEASHLSSDLPFYGLPFHRPFGSTTLATSHVLYHFILPFKFCLILNIHLQQRFSHLQIVVQYPKILLSCIDFVSSFIISIHFF
jgi:hypothetical protein